MALTAPTPPTPPTIDKGDVQPSTPRIDAHQFFEIPEMPFKREEGVGKREQDSGNREQVKDETADTLTDNKNSAQSSTAEKNPAQISNADKNSNVAADSNQTPRQEVTPEVMARDAVANGSGALTKNTVTRIDDADSKPAPAENNLQSSTVNSTPVAESVPVMQMPPADTSADRYERGQAVLREFRDEDKRLAESSNETSASTAATSTFQSHSNYEESHGGFFWIFTLIFVVLATFFVAKKFLFRAKPALRKSDLFEGTGDKLKTTAEKFSNATKTSDFAKTKPLDLAKTFDAAKNVKPADKPTTADKSKTAKKSQTAKTSKPADADKKTPPVKPVTLPKKDDDGKGKHFEIRV
ncbi:MAG: hypothetical protein IJU91_00510 [Selenomonadaceae bacterium]|nr:hypothetical protein [Selenomonadaceae bacterium]